MIQCQHNKIKLILRPDTPHYAEKRCEECNSFLGWQPSPNPEGIRKTSSKYEIKNICKQKHMNEEPFCFFCRRIKQQLGETETLTIDHIKPIRENGTDEIDNIQILCTACHKLRHWTELYLNKHINQKNEHERQTKLI